MIIRPEEWISKPDQDGNGQLNAWMEDGEVNFPIPIETHNVFPEDVRMNEAQDSEFSDDVQMKEGNIVSCVYRVQGWPKLDDNTCESTEGKTD